MRYCRGWFIGEKEDRKALEKDLRERHPDVVREGSDLKALNEEMWKELVRQRMSSLGKTEEDLGADRTSFMFAIAHLDPFEAVLL